MASRNLFRYRIMCRLTDGTELEAFVWRGTLEAGIAQAHVDAKLHGKEVDHAWGLPV